MTNDYNTKLIEEFRANDGRVGGPWEGTPLILVHDIGAKSGIEHVTPLGCFPKGTAASWSSPPTVDPDPPRLVPQPQGQRQC